MPDSHRNSLETRFAGAWGSSDGYRLILLTLLALAIRLPHWQTIPAAGDEVGQAMYALQIAQGQGLPLVGNDAYAGPFFFYLLAALFRLGVHEPLVGRVVILVAGTLIAPVTYAWIRRLGGTGAAGLVAGMLVAANPHLILLNSHVGGTTFLLPFLTSLFLLLLTCALDTDRPGWLIASAGVAGLALQSNPLAGLLVAGGWLWATGRMRTNTRLGRWWPLWPLAGGLCVALVYSPVIVYNITSGLNSLDIAGQRSYLWETDHSLPVVLSNALRLILQLIRQTSGVLVGDETPRSIVGMPLVYLAWLLAGIAFVTRQVSRLPVAAIAPFLLTLPVLSNHYGMIDPVRFTSPLTPVFAASMGFLSAAVWERVTAGPGRRAPWRPVVAGSLVAALVGYPLIALVRYYGFIEAGHLSGQTMLDLSRQMVELNRGEPVYIGDSTPMRLVAGIPYVPQSYLLFAGMHQEFLPPEQIVARLFKSPGPADMLVGDQDAALIQKTASLTPWPGAANEQARQSGYGLYRLNTGVPLVRPGFVLSGASALELAPTARLGIQVGSGLELIGYDAPAVITPGETLKLSLYWRATGPMPDGTYIGFVHLIDPATSAIIAQDDHELGRQRYPVSVWQPDESVAERYSLLVPDGVAAGQYALRAGVYTWPDLIRLSVPGHPDDVIGLAPVSVDR